MLMKETIYVYFYKNIYTIFISDVPCSFRHNSELAISFLVSICCLSVVWIAAGSTDTHFVCLSMFLSLSHTHGHIQELFCICELC